MDQRQKPGGKDVRTIQIRPQQPNTPNFKIDPQADKQLNRQNFYHYPLRPLKNKLKNNLLIDSRALILYLDSIILLSNILHFFSQPTFNTETTRLFFYENLCPFDTKTYYYFI